MSQPTRVVVVGSYPPIPRPAAAASIAAVKDAWVQGLEVQVVSPRLSAAHLAVPVYGLLAGRRLENVRRHTGASRLVLVVEDGFPFRPGPAAFQRLTVALLRPALGRFDDVTVVLVGEPGLPARVAEGLARDADRLVRRPAGDAGPPGVTPTGPVEVPVRDRPRQFTAAVARRVLGPRAGAIRRRAIALRRSFSR